MILHTETSKLLHNWSFLFVVLHKPTLLPSTFLENIHFNPWCFCEASFYAKLVDAACIFALVCAGRWTHLWFLDALEKKFIATWSTPIWSTTHLVYYSMPQTPISPTLK